MTTANRSELVQRHLREWALFILAIGVILRLQGLDWDAGNIFNPDEYNLARGASMLAFPDHLVPQFHAYNGLSLYLPRVLAEGLSLFTGRPGSDTGALVFAGRVLSATWSCLTLVVLWRIAREQFGAATGLFVLACGAAAPALIQSAHFATTEAGLMLCLMVIVWLAARHVAGMLPAVTFGLLSGGALGLGFGLKSSALAMALIPVAAMAITVVRLGGLPQAIRAMVVMLGVLGGLALLTTPQIWADWRAYFATMQFESAVVSGAADVFWTYQFSGSIPVLFELGQLFWLLGPGLAALGLAGLCVVMVDTKSRKPSAAAFLPAACFVIVYAIIIFTWHARFVRYLAILCPVLIIFSGYFVSRLLNTKLRTILMVGVAVATGVAGLLQAAIYQAPDPRIAAWEWLAPQIGDQRVIMEPAEVGPSYWAQRAAQPLIEMPVLAPSTPEKVLAMADILSRGGWMVIASRRHHGVLPRLLQRFPEMCGYYRALWSGELGYVAIARFQRRPDFGAIFPPELWAEETFTVFDSPQVLVLQKVRTLPPADVVAAITRNTENCTNGRE